MDTPSLQIATRSQVDEKARTSSSIVPTTWGCLPRDIWMVMLEIVTEDFDGWAQCYYETSINPYWSDAGFFTLNNYDGFLMTVQKLNREFKREVRKSILNNVSVVFDRAVCLRYFHLDLPLDIISWDPKLSIRKVYLSIYLWRALGYEDMDELLSVITNGEIPGLREVTIDFIVLHMRYPERCWTPIDKSAAWGTRGAFALICKAAKISVKKLTVLGLADKALAAWIEGFGSGNWTRYDAILAEDAAILAGDFVSEDWGLVGDEPEEVQR